MAELRRVYTQVFVDGVAIEDLIERIAEIDIEERTDGLTSARLLLDLAPTDDDTWDALADERFQLLKRLSIAIGLGPVSGEQAEFMDTIFEGYVTELAPSFGEQRVPESSLEVHALCAGSLMHLEERVYDWKDDDDAGIAGHIFESYGFAFEGPDRVTPRRDERDTTVLQRTTDLEHLRAMARRLGFDCYVEPLTDAPEPGVHPGERVVGHFHAPRLDDALQHPLDLFPETGANVIEFQASITSHAPTRMVGRHIDTQRRVQLVHEATEPEVRKMGRTSRAELLTERLTTLRQQLPNRTDGPQAASNSPEADREHPTLTQRGLRHSEVPGDQTDLDALTRAAWLEADWVAEGTGTVAATAYPAILRARRPVFIDGLGDMLDGRWYVRRATHKWRNNTDYTVEIDVCRNALYATEADANEAAAMRLAVEEAP